MNSQVGDSNKKSSSDFDRKKELSTLVNQKVIPLKVAEKIDEKLKEKNVKVTKEQLHSLVYKIRDVFENYVKNGKPIKQQKWEQPTENMQKLVETIERLEKRISIIEKEKTTSHKFVTTSDITIPFQELELDPLQEIPSDPESIIVLMKWLQYLMDKCGRDNLSNILDYYVDIGWISQDAKISLIDYSQGITEEKRSEGTAKKDVSHLPSKDHIQSLIYINKLKGRQFDKHFLERIDGELARITKKLDNYQFK
ncbi:hypothetical protein AYK24_01950 [Thermoplasmatales archaeon SG8-52-4]|nr:MAG: hypothetical protein AYK24_01950 [Thermoplasmatales archaeon SG8-52-4]